MQKRLLPNAKRCEWAGTDPLYIAYHDNEWGVPVHDDLKLFEFLILEGFQAGLSWITILRKRENFRKAFANWDWRIVAKFNRKDVARLMLDAGIVRNRLKIESTIDNAKSFIKIRQEFGTFDRYIWQFTGGKAIRQKHRALSFKELPCNSPESDVMSKELKKRGFRFVGTTICYSFMQAMGMVDDHIKGCYKTKK